MTRASLAGLVLLAGLGLTAGAHAQEKILRVCFGEYDAPRADQTSGSGFDMDVMRAVAERTGRILQSVWVEQEAKMTEAENSDLPLPALAKGRCDAVASVPGKDALRGARVELSLSQPYYGAGFEFVSAPGGPKDYSELKDRTIVVQFMTVGHLAATAAGYHWIGVTSPEEQMAALRSGKADAALIWGPALGPLNALPQPNSLPSQVLRWNEHVATRASDTELTGAIDTALQAMLASGEIAKLMQAHHMPARAPFEGVFNQGALIKLQLHR